MLVGDFFAQADGLFQIFAVFQFGLQRLELGEFIFHQIVDTVQGNATVIADDAATAVSVGQTGQHARFTTAQDIGGVNIENALVMGFTVVGEDFLQARIQLAVICFAGAFHHFDAAERNDGAFKRCIGLQADDLFQFFIDIAGVMGGNGGGDIGIKIDRRMGAVLDFDPFHHFFPQRRRGGAGARQESFVAFIGSVVFLDEVTHVDFFLPVACGKTFPGRGQFVIQIGHYTPTF